MRILFLVNDSQVNEYMSRGRRYLFTLYSHIGHLCCPLLIYFDHTAYLLFDHIFLCYVAFSFLFLSIFTLICLVFQCCRLGTCLKFFLQFKIIVLYYYRFKRLHYTKLRNTTDLYWALIMSLMNFIFSITIKFYK